MKDSPPPARPAAAPSRAVLILLVLAALGAAGWWLLARPPGAPAASGAPAAKAEARPQPVLARAVEARPMPLRIDAVGTVQATAVVAVRPRVEGTVDKVHFTEGQEVKEGDLLFSLDARAAEATRRQAEANLARDRAQLERARADLQRYSQLIRSGAVAQQRLDQAAADVGVLEASVKAGQAAIESARLSQDYAAIRAPVSGRTGVINAKQGSLAKPGDAQAMVTITPMRPITVAFSVAESRLPAIRAAMAGGAVPALVTSPADPSLAAEGRLSFIDSAIDTTTGTIALKASFANDDLRLWPGQFVSVALTLGVEEAALVVPAEAVQTGQTGPFVFLVTAEATAELRAVSVERSQDGLAVIGKGLAAGDKVVVEGQMRLAPGMRVAEKK